MLVNGEIIISRYTVIWLACDKINMTKVVQNKTFAHVTKPLAIFADFQENATIFLTFFWAMANATELSTQLQPMTSGNKSLAF